MTSNNLDALECKSPMWEKIPPSKQAFTKSQPQKITISMADLNGALFRRKNYTYDLNNGGGHQYKGSAHGHDIDIKKTQYGEKVTITASLKNAQGHQVINLTFMNKEGQCTLTDGRLKKNGMIESLNDPKRLSETLLCIYKHVRLSSDPKWATSYLMELEAREIAAQPLTLDSFPKIINNNSQLIFKKPEIEGVCGNICGQGSCPAKAMIQRL